MPSQDPRIVEISNLKKKVLEVETQLREEKKISARLREASEKKIEQVNLVDSEITAEMERFRWKKEEILFQIRSTEEELKGSVDSLKVQEKALLADIADYDLQLSENHRLQSKVKSLSQEYHKVLQEQSDERNLRTQKNFDTRMAMEEIMRKMVKNVDSTYENDAILRMKREASFAHIENERIHREFDIRETKTEALIRQQQRSYDMLMRLRIELDMMTISTDIQEKNILKSIEQNQKMERETISASAHVEALRDQLHALKMAYEGKQILEEEIKLVRQKTQKNVHQIEKYRKMSVQLAHKILRECEEIGDKSRTQLSKQITQQLSELSTDNDRIPATPSTRGHTAYSMHEKSLSFGFLPSENAVDFDFIWRPSQPVAVAKGKASFSMMFNEG